MSFVKNVGLTLVTNLGVTAVGLATSVLLARSLGPAGRGVLTTLLLWPAMLTWAGGLGLSHANIYFGAAEPSARRSLFANSLWAALILGSLVGSIAAWIVPPLVHVHGPIRVLLMFGLFSLPICIWGECASGLLQGASQFRAMASIRTVCTLLTAALLAVLFVTHRLTVTAAALATWGPSWLGVVLTVRFLVGDGVAALWPDIPMLRRAVAYSSRIQLGNLAGIANGRMDQLLMTAIVAPRALGLYAFAVALTELLNQVAGSIGAVLVPKVAETNDKKASGRLAAQSVRWVLIIDVLAASVLYFVAPLLIRVLWGSRFLGALPAIHILLPGAVAIGVNGALTAGLRGVGKPIGGTISQLASLAVMVPMLLYYLPRLGIYGAGLASTCGYSVACVTACFFFARTFGLSTLIEAVCPTVRDWQDVRGLMLRAGHRVKPKVAVSES